MSHWRTILPALACVLLLAGVGCTRASGQETGAAAPQVFEVKRDTLTTTITATGSIDFSRVARLTFGATGSVRPVNSLTEVTVAEVLVQWGDIVKAGAPLARLEAGDLELAVAQAEIKLLQAQDSLAVLLTPPSAAAVARAQATVAAGDASLAAAREALEQALSQELAQAKTQADVARTTLANVQRDVALARIDREAKLEPAQKKFDEARELWVNFFKGWLGIDLTRAEVDTDPETLLKAWGVDLESLFSREARFKGVSTFTEGHVATGLPPDDPKTRWNEEVIYIRLNLQPGTIVAWCGDAPARSQEVCIEREMDKVWDAYKSAKRSLETVVNGSDKAIAAAESAVAKAQEGLGTAEQTLATLQKGAAASVFLQKQAQVKSAEATLAAAQETLAEVVKPPKEFAVAEKRQQVRAAEVAFAEAKRQLTQATLRAPFAGVVSQVNIEASQSVSTNFVAIVMVDPQSASITAQVDQVDVAQLAPGQPVTVSLEALPNARARATVAAANIAGRVQGGVVSYDVRLSLLPPLIPALRQGMTATVEIVTQRVENVLLVPVRAVQVQNRQQTVTVQEGEKQVSRPVRLGERNDRFVVVLEGLKEGEKVLVPQAAGPTSQQFRGFGGGGFPGGGIPGGGGRR
jgi:HlyD family secretion protein